MASNRQKEKIGDDTPAGSGSPIDLDITGDECNAKTCDQNHGAKDVDQTGGAPKKPNRSKYFNEDALKVWKDRCLRRDGEVKEMANKLTDLQSVDNFMMQNNVM